jgi:hypothetical protein
MVSIGQLKNKNAKQAISAWNSGLRKGVLNVCMAFFPVQCINGADPAAHFAKPAVDVMA